MARSKPLFAFSLRTRPVPGEPVMLKSSLQGWTHGMQLFSFCSRREKPTGKRLACSQCWKNQTISNERKPRNKIHKDCAKSMLIVMPVLRIASFNLHWRRGSTTSVLPRHHILSMLHPLIRGMLSPLGTIERNGSHPQRNKRHGLFWNQNYLQPWPRVTYLGLPKRSVSLWKQFHGAL